MVFCFRPSLLLSLIVVVCVLSFVVFIVCVIFFAGRSLIVYSCRCHDRVTCIIVIVIVIAWG